MSTLTMQKKKSSWHKLVHAWSVCSSLDNMSLNDEKVKFSGGLYYATHADNDLSLNVRAVNEMGKMGV